MLQNIRNNIQGVMAKIIIGLIIVPFAVFGIDSLVGGSGVVNVVEINGEDVSEQELLQAISMQKRRLMNMMGENADPNMFDDDLLREPALEQLIQQKLLLQAAEKASIGVSSKALDQAIVGMVQFQEEGQFSSQLYQNILRSNGMSMSYFKEVMGHDMVLNQLNTGLASSDFVTEKELMETAKVVGQKRSFRYFILPHKKIAESIDISDIDIEAFFQENLSDFQTENRVKLGYVEIKQQDFFKAVDEKELKLAYDLDMADFEADEERRASHILIEITDERNQEQAKALVMQLIKRINEGESFAALAAEYSGDVGSARNAGDLGFSKGDTFPDVFETALFQLEQNQLSEPVLTDSGYHLIRVTEIKGENKPSYEEHKPILKQRLQLAAAELEFVSTVEQLRDLVFNSEDLSGPAQELKLAVAQSNWVTKHSGEGVLGNRQVLKAAFSSDVLEDSNNSEVLELAADHFIVIRVVEHEQSHAKDLADVKEQIVKKLTTNRASGQVIEMAQEAVQELSAGKQLEDIARSKDYQWQVELSATRNSANIARELVSAAFDMSVVPEGKMVVKTVPMNNGDAAVLQLEKVDDGSWADFSVPQQNGMRRELQRNNATRSMEGFVGTIRELAEIKRL